MGEVMTMDWNAAFAGRAEAMHASEIRELLKLLDQPDIISFAGGIPDPALFPADAIREAISGVLGHNDQGAHALQYSTSEGYLPLRRWIVEAMGRQGVPCEPDNIVITSGSQQGLDFLGKLLIGPGDTVLVARPTYLGALQAFNAYEPRYGIMVPGEAQDAASAHRASAGASGGRIAMAYAVPDFANPTGLTMPEPARRDMLGLCATLGIPLIEDAAYTELRFQGDPVASCLALDIAANGSIERSRVVFCGTFSKTIAPGLRVGWVCASRDLVHKLVLAKQAADLHSATLNQMVMHRVVQSGYDAHIRTLRTVYAARRDAMLAALERFMPPWVHWTVPEGGMFIWLTLPDGHDGAAMLSAALAEERVAFVPGGAFHADGGGRNAIRLAYSLQPEPRIEEGMRRLGQLMARTTPQG